jgi:hypothetical protein
MKRRTLSVKGQQLVADLLIELGVPHLTCGDIQLHFNEARVQRVRATVDFTVQQEKANV